jgi:4-amino-4-deoxy-L-arabinose transferase-like glycosyltransferase
VRKRTLLLFFLAVAILYFSALGTIPLLEPDEGRYAEIPREMLASGDFVTPRLNGVVYLEKPPLSYWGTAASLRLFGETEFGARCFTAAVSVAGVLLTCWMGAALAGRRTGAAGEAIAGALEKAQLPERSFRTALLRGRAVPCSV